MRRLYRLFAASVFAGACMVNVSFAQEPTPEMLKLVPEVHKAVDADAKGVQEIYKDIHEHAELGFMETRTAGIVANFFQYTALTYTLYCQFLWSLEVH